MTPHRDPRRIGGPPGRVAAAPRVETSRRDREIRASLVILALSLLAFAWCLLLHDVRAGLDGLSRATPPGADADLDAGAEILDAAEYRYAHAGRTAAR